MKTLAPVAIAMLVLFCFAGSAPARTKSENPCRDKDSNAGMRECYSKEQARINAATDVAASKVAAGLRKQAQDVSDGPVAADLLRKTASAVTLSQKNWKAYRDQHCNAVMYSWTTGSGAGTAYEKCLFQLAQGRLQELRSAFNGYLVEPATQGRK